MHRGGSWRCDGQPGVSWSVQDLGEGLHLFRWERGFYVSPFVVTSEGVVAFDPIDEQAATAYRQAIGSVTKAPICAIVYSHDHRDHIVGAAQLSHDADVIGHTLTQARIEKRGDRDIRHCTRLIEAEECVNFGDYQIEFHYLGPNHSDSNLAVILPSGMGRVLQFVDVIEPGTTPYRNLPDTDFRGLLRSLDLAADLEFDQVIGGHTGPDSSVWVDRYRQYFRDLVEATERGFSAAGGQSPRPDEDGVAMTERVRAEACRQVAAALEPTYGRWAGFKEWAPMNADRALSYLITGN
jgi:glyoxylase-like metal-dependent hydrolase (beta-lactamase superfamily II)